MVKKVIRGKLNSVSAQKDLQKVLAGDLSQTAMAEKYGVTQGAISSRISIMKKPSSSKVRFPKVRQALAASSELDQILLKIKNMSTEERKTILKWLKLLG